MSDDDGSVDGAIVGIYDVGTVVMMIRSSIQYVIVIEKTIIICLLFVRHI